MTFGTPTKEGLQELRNKRRDTEACAQSLLIGAKAEHQDVLNDAESRQFRELTANLRSLDERIERYEHELRRCGELPENLRKLTERGQVYSAGRLAPLGFPDDEMRRMQSAMQRGESCRLDSRAFSTADSLLPSQLFPYPIEQQHDNRVLDRLPGYAMDSPQITFIRHISTTGLPTR